MEGVKIRAFISRLEKIDRSLLTLLTRFRIEERGGKIRLLTEDPSAVDRMRTFLSTLHREALGDVELVLEEEEGREGPAPDRIVEGLSSRYSFENFVVGEGNRLAYEVSLSVARNPGGLYNPLFLYGKVGLGKTHLLQAIGNFCASRGMSVVYRSATDFSEEMVEHIKGGRIREFRERYRSVDLLLLDDVQFLSGKSRTQDEFFNIFNYMYLREKQIVLASDRHPRELRDVSDRLVSRFEGGVVVEISLDELTKLEIIRKKLEELKLEVQDRIVELLMRSTSDNVREIEGAVRGVKLKGASYLRDRGEKKGDLEKVVAHVALHFGLRVEDLMGDSRSRRINRARQIAMYLCRKLTASSLTEIARVLNRRDHSTVLHGIRRIEQERRRDRKLNHILSFLESHIGARL